MSTNVVQQHLVLRGVGSNPTLITPSNPSVYFFFMRSAKLCLEQVLTSKFLAIIAFQLKWNAVRLFLCFKTLIVSAADFTAALRESLSRDRCSGSGSSALQSFHNDVA